MCLYIALGICLVKKKKKEKKKAGTSSLKDDVRCGIQSGVFLHVMVSLVVWTLAMWKPTWSPGRCL